MGYNILDNTCQVPTHNTKANVNRWIKFVTYIMKATTKRRGVRGSVYTVNTTQTLNDITTSTQLANPNGNCLVTFTHFTLLLIDVSHLLQSAW